MRLIEISKGFTEGGQPNQIPVSVYSASKTTYAALHVGKMEPTTCCCFWNTTLLCGMMHARLINDQANLNIDDDSDEEVESVTLDEDDIIAYLEDYVYKIRHENWQVG
jgi:hypothetical protein